MKKTICTLVLSMLVVAMSFAQSPKPQYGKTQPSFIKPVEAIPAYQKAAVFQTYLDLSDHDELRSVKTTTDQLGFTHEKYQQYYKGVEVEGATYTFHAKDGIVQSLTGNFKTVVDLDVSPTLSESKALNNALTYVNASEYAWDEGNSLGYDHFETPHGHLVVYAHPEGAAPPRLAYKFDIYASDPLYRADVFIDAHTGEFIADHEKIHVGDVPATATTLYNSNRSITADYTGSNYRLRQTASGNGVETYSLNNGTNYNNATDITSSTSNFTSDFTANQAHWGAEQTHSYFMTKHGRNSYDGNGAKLLSYVHYSTNYVNAFWDGIRMTYGDGDGSNYGPLVSLDICGHELAHGVTEYSANLVYQNESGALNESFSDIFGEAVENYATGFNDWRMGEEIGAGGSGGAIRNMANPNEFSDPDTYFGTYWYTGSGDNGGVHTNSGVQNKWFYILTAGESGTNDLQNAYSVTGIGMTKAAEIAYRNLTVYLSTNSNYNDARVGAIQSAIDLYGAGSPEEIATTNAWYAVGVGAEYQPPIGCVDAVVDLTIVLDNYPGETTWTLKDAGGATLYSGGPYSTAGSTVNESFTLTTGDYTFTINDSYGDGICCGYGQGSYTLVSNGVTIVSGGAFGSSEVTNFCVETGAPITGCMDQNAHNYDPNATQPCSNCCETCTDGVQNGDETGVDCGGSNPNCSSCGGGGGGSNTILAHFFESGWDGWQDGGSDCYRYSGSRSWEGNYSIRIRDNSGTASAMTSGSYDVSSYSSLEIEFYFYAYSMENGEDFWVRYYDGSSWHTVAAYAQGTSFNNNSFYVATVTVSSANFNFPSNAQFRFQCDASGNQDHIYIDAVTVTGVNTFMAGSSGQTIRELSTPVDTEMTSFLEEDDSEVLLYPNPASEFVNLETDLEIRSVRVLSLNGAVVKEVSEFEKGYGVDVSELKGGFYLISIETNEGTINKKFVKQ